MSQFLLCKSKEDLSKYGIPYKNVEFNKDIYTRVVNEYMNDKVVNNIWVIDKIHDMINSLENSIEIIEEIIKKSEFMVFWYGSDFEDLERISSGQSLMEYLKAGITDSSLELYLLVDLKRE